jgi:cell division protein FtsL
MDSSTIVQIVTIVTGAIVTIVGLLVRSRIMALEQELRGLKTIITAQNAIINGLGNQIKSLSAQLVMARKE